MTILVGTNTTARTDNSGGNIPCALGFSVFTAAATGNATQMNAYLSESLSIEYVLAIYNGAGNTLLGYTPTALPSSGAPGVITGALNAPVAIVEGTEYVLAILSSNGDIAIYSDGSTTTPNNDARASTAKFETWPAALSAATYGGYGSYSLWATGGPSSVVISGGKALMSNGHPVIGQVLRPSYGLALAPLAWVIERRRRHPS